MSGLSGTQAESRVRAAFQTLPDLVILPICVYLSAVHPPHEETEKKKKHRCSGLGWGGVGEERDREDGRRPKPSSSLPGGMLTVPLVSSEIPLENAAGGGWEWEVCGTPS